MTGRVKDFRWSQNLVSDKTLTLNVKFSNWYQLRRQDTDIDIDIDLKSRQLRRQPGIAGR